MLKRLFPILVAGLMSMLAMPGLAEDSPQDTVQTSVGAILDLLKDDTMEKETRRLKIRAIINERFDFRAMSQRTLATNWKKASDEEKEQFVGLFSQLIENTYIGKIESYTNEKVEYPGETVKGRKAVVETLIITSSADIPVDYRLYEKDGKWLVYDVIIEGVSLISNYRSSYREIVSKEGFDGLLARMQDKIRELESQPDEQPA
ncbi:MAG: ABC transporter substrate-binding protein [Gammaproteobacteria bacterium]|jgi:phospholipid transport system substrate-binding protein